MKTKFIKSIIFLFGIGALYSCSSKEEFLSIEKEGKDILTTKTIVENDFIVPLEGQRDTLKRPIKIARNQFLQEELTQLRGIPFYLQAKGNSTNRQFLNAIRAGSEVTVENYNGSTSQQFYLQYPPATTGIPYLIYSKQTNTPLKVGTYSSQPNVKILFADYANSSSSFGASWDFSKAKYSANAFVIENQDIPEQGNSGNWWDIYYPVITVNDAKVSLSKYNNSSHQEFEVIPDDIFEVESIEFIVDASAVLIKEPNILVIDSYTNDTGLQQSHKFTISKTYKESSSYNRKTSYNVNIATDFKCKVPFVASGEIKTSTTVGQDYTYGESQELTTYISKEYPVIVQPFHVTTLNLTLFNYTMDVEYVATCWAQKAGKRVKIRGRWRGVDVIENDALITSRPINGGPSKSKVITKEMLESKDPIRL